jgi:pimeloyl-ACP methyl ester carboxylesterase
MWPSFSAEQQARMMAEGRLELPSQYSLEPNVITREMIEDGRRNLVMGGPIAFDGPVRVLAGGDDPDVPLAHVTALAELLQGDDHSMQVIPDGDHRLSRPQDLDMLIATASALRDKLAR